MTMDLGLLEPLLYFGRSIAPLLKVQPQILKTLK